MTQSPPERVTPEGSGPPKPGSAGPTPAGTTPATNRPAGVPGAGVQNPEQTSALCKDIDVLIRARYPILYVVTHEEERAESSLFQIARAQNKQCLSWSVTRGLMPTGTDIQSKKKISEMTRDPLAALETVVENLEHALFIFKDFHPYLQDNTIVRKIRELAGFLRDSPRTLIFISPVLRIPTELEKEITVLEFGLPAPREIAQKLDEMVDQVKDNPKVSISLNQEDREKLVKACTGLTLREVENVLAKTIISRRKLGSDDLSAILQEKEQIIRKSGVLEYYGNTEAFQNVGGLENLKTWLTKRSQAFTEKAKAFGCTPPRGILLLGVQGCGKSLVAKAVSSLWSVPLLRLDMGRIFSSLVGSSEENVRRAIRTAESVAPAILWVDEIEKAFSGTQSSGQSDGGVSNRVFGTFITWLQEKTSPVFVIATANRIRELPPELFRKGRFDDIFFVDLPSPAEREQIFTIHLKKKNRNPALFDLTALSHASDGYSGSEIEEAVSSALYEAFFQNRELATDMILQTLRETFPLSRTMREDIEDLRRWAGERARAASRPQTETGTGRLARALEIS